MTEKIGLDIIEVHRIENAIRRWQDRFLKRIYTQAEIRYCRGKRARSASFAARFAAKEAVWKTLGLKKGHNPLWSEVEIGTNQDGDPHVILRGKAKKVAAGKDIALSLSHTSEYAVAIALLMRQT
ncbi:MAG: holo-ACP synthase [Gemmatimonadota bacterium]|nr:MAG: holo-ACP synthase [Gemmatimonadota bacterium]